MGHYAAAAVDGPAAAAAAAAVGGHPVGIANPSLLVLPRLPVQQRYVGLQAHSPRLLVDL